MFVSFIKLATGKISVGFYPPTRLFTAIKLPERLIKSFAAITPNPNGDDTAFSTNRRGVVNPILVRKASPIRRRICF